MKKFLRVIAVAMLLLAIAIPCMAESNVCSETKGEHEWVEKVADRVKPNCTTAGKAFYTCKCGAYKEVELPATDHDYSTGAKVVTGTPSSCTEQGTGYVYCKNAGCTEHEDIKLPLADHVAVKNTDKNWKKDATCGKDGFNVVEYCKNCKAIMTKETIPATGKHELHRVEHAAKDCTEKAYSQLECKLCDYVDKSSKVVGKAGAHTPSQYDYTLISEATCTKPEMRAPYCTVCGKTLDAVEHGKKLGHDYDLGTVDKKATCTTEGSRHWNCKRCGEIIETQKIAKLNHAETVVTIVEPTCTKAGSNTTTCKLCGEVMETITIPATGHGATEWKVTKEATACDNGVMSEVCKDCDTVLNTKEIAATGKGKHEARDEWTIVRQPNAYQEGKAIKTCKYCDVQMAKKYFTNAASLGNAKVDTSKKDTTTSSSSSSSKNNTTSSSSASKNNTAATTSSTAAVKAVVAVEPVVVTEWKLGEKFEIADGVYMTITLNAETNKYDVVVEGVDNIETAKIAFVKADATEAPAEEDYIDLIESNWVINAEDVDEAAILYIVID